MRLEILVSEAHWERTLSPFIAALQSIGVNASIRLVDASLYRHRVNQADFDMVVHWMMTSQRPGQELYFRFSSDTAKTPGSENISGIQDPTIDQIIATLMSASNDAQRLAAAKTLDETLHNNAIAIGLWHDRRHRIAHAAALRSPLEPPLYYSGEQWFITAGWWATQERLQRRRQPPHTPAP